MGYAMAGFEVVGVDINPQPRYPFEFYQADAMEYPLDGFDVIHASPPCQRYSNITAVHGDRERHPDLVPAVQTRLRESGLPYVIENVEGAPLEAPLTLCGTMFPGLRVIRHRIFESNVDLYDLPHLLHPPVYSSDQRRPGRDQDPNTAFVMVVGNNVGVIQGGAAMGINWMRIEELTQAIPPAYTRHIGSQVRRHLLGLPAERREMMQQCSRCKEMLPISRFSRDRRRGNGIAGKCKPCKLLGDKRTPRYSAAPTA